MQPISAKDKKILAQRKQVCDRCGRLGVEWHHVFAFAGKQIKDWFNIAFACKSCHSEATPHNNKYKQGVREYFEWHLLKQHFEKFVYKYPKKDWKTLWNYYVNQFAAKTPKRK